MRTVSAWALAKRLPRLMAATVAADPLSSDRREVVLARDVTARVITRSSRVLPLLWSALLVCDQGRRTPRKVNAETVTAAFHFRATPSKLVLRSSKETS